MSCSWLSCVPAYFLLRCNEGFSFSKWYFWSHTPNWYVLHSLPILYLEQLCYWTLRLNVVPATVPFFPFWRKRRVCRFVGLVSYDYTFAFRRLMAGQLRVSRKGEDVLLVAGLIRVQQTGLPPPHAVRLLQHG